MAAKLAAAVILTSLFAVACSRAPSTQQLAGLATSAPAMLAQAGAGGEIPRGSWPSTVALLQPEQVRAAPEGLYVVLSRSGVEEHGLFVPRTSSFNGSAGTDPSYTPVGQGVFSYHVKG